MESPDFGGTAAVVCALSGDAGLAMVASASTAPDGQGVCLADGSSRPGSGIIVDGACELPAGGAPVAVTSRARRLGEALAAGRPSLCVVVGEDAAETNRLLFGPGGLAEAAAGGFVSAGGDAGGLAVSWLRVRGPGASPVRDAMKEAAGERGAAAEADWSGGPGGLECPGAWAVSAASGEEAGGLLRMAATSPPVEAVRASEPGAHDVVRLEAGGATCAVVRLAPTSAPEPATSDGPAWVWGLDACLKALQSAADGASGRVEAEAEATAACSDHAALAAMLAPMLRPGARVLLVVAARADTAEDVSALSLLRFAARWRRVLGAWRAACTPTHSAPPSPLAFSPARGDPAAAAALGSQAWSDAPVTPISPLSPSPRPQASRTSGPAAPGPSRHRASPRHGNPGLERRGVRHGSPRAAASPRPTGLSRPASWHATASPRSSGPRSPHPATPIPTAGAQAARRSRAFSPRVRPVGVPRTDAVLPASPGIRSRHAPSPAAPAAAASSSPFSSSAFSSSSSSFAAAAAAAAARTHPESTPRPGSSRSPPALPATSPRGVPSSSRLAMLLAREVAARELAESRAAAAEAEADAMRRRAEAAEEDASEAAEAVLRRDGATAEETAALRQEVGRLRQLLRARGGALADARRHVEVLEAAAGRLRGEAEAAAAAANDAQEEVRVARAGAARERAKAGKLRAMARTARSGREEAEARAGRSAALLRLAREAEAAEGGEAAGRSGGTAASWAAHGRARAGDSKAAGSVAGAGFARATESWGRRSGAGPAGTPLHKRLLLRQPGRERERARPAARPASPDPMVSALGLGPAAGSESTLRVDDLG